MARGPGPENEGTEPKEDKRKVCGIVMPIAAMGEEYSEEHWRRVRKVLQKAVDRSQMQSRLVWDNPEIDVIQSAILQNIYESDVVICDVSGLNPNVMLETGLRLSTKRPTVIVTDRIAKPPFDIGTIGYIEYQRDLEYNATEDFIDRLSSKIKSVLRASEAGSYQSFVEQFKFETVTPATVNVSADDFVREQLSFLSRSVQQIQRSQQSEAATTRSRTASTSSARTSTTQSGYIKVRAKVVEELANEIESRLDQLPDDFGASSVLEIDPGVFRFTVPVRNTTNISYSDARDAVLTIFKRFGVNEFEVD